MTMIFKVAEQFTDAPGGRFRKDGDHSGEELRDDYLIPLLDENPNEKLTIDFDGIYGIASSTLDEVFYGLVKQKGAEVIDRIEIVSWEDPSVLFDALDSMNEALMDD